MYQCSHAPCASNCACAEGLHFSAFHLNSVRVDGYSTCPVEIESFSDPLCEGSSSTEAPTNAVGSSAGTGAIAGSIVGGLALIAVVIVALYIYLTWYKHKLQHKSRYGIIIIACISHI